MEDQIDKRHNKTLLLYHIVFPVKYRNSFINEKVGEEIFVFLYRKDMRLIF